MNPKNKREKETIIERPSKREKMHKCSESKTQNWFVKKVKGKKPSTSMIRRKRNGEYKSDIMTKLTELFNLLRRYYEIYMIKLLKLRK